MPESLLEAITNSISGDEDASAEHNEEETTIEDSDSADDSESDAGAGDDEASADEADGAESGEDAEEGKPAEGADTKPAEAKGKKDEKPAEGTKDEKPKQKDAVNDPIPKELKASTRERITDLIGKVKTISSERDQAVAQREELFTAITETKASPQQYAESLQFLKLVNSQEPADQEKALSILQAGVDQLARRLGKAVPGVDMLSGHEDLRKEVKDGLISLQRAMELAAGRERGKVEAQRSQQTQQMTQQQAQMQQDLHNGREALNQLEAQLKATDPQYAQKREILINALKPVFSQLHPSQWAQAFKQSYDNLKVTAPAQAPRAVSKVPVNQPLRVKNPAGGNVKAPTSIAEAINMGIAQAGR